ncbi:HlyD family type I secretion periplasmic adaptor subunit [Salidesulfovibrio onnuriiensis]|uniref:HlyD family type I secretion periplasmic adaptor subunit n=1 Tax=Salidesulfovibrio onnuriiensis TaxID=2583823 RepID=UPI0011C7D96A|nr:HlyD family type I secretion periplasmic adaptor subunit [Salidesulfovibrio onnuriiensis]
MADNGLPKRQNDVSLSTRMLFYLCSAFCLCFILWASVAPLDIVSDTVGEVIPSTKVKRIQHLEGGIVSEIKVREGESVQADQPLVELESTASWSTAEELRIRVKSLMADVARLEAEERWFAADTDGNSTQIAFKPGGVSPRYPDVLLKESPELIKQADNLYEARLRSLENDIRVERERITQREKDIEEIQVRLSNHLKNFQYVREQISISEDLLKENLTTRYKHLGFLKEETQLKSKIGEERTSLDRARSELASAHEELDSVYNRHREQVQKAMAEAKQEYMEFSQRLKKLEDSLKRTVIRSPVAGVVKGVYLVNEGEVVMPGVTIMDIVPTEDRLVIEAHLPLSDIGYVSVGQEAIVRLASRDARRFGMLAGNVKNVSPDAISTTDKGTFYKVLVETSKDHFERDGNIYQLYPGMRVLVGIKTGERTVLEYLLYPYFDTLYQGLRER